MCGIAAILLAPQERSVADWRGIKNTLTQNLIVNQERGRAATGLVVLFLRKMFGPAVRHQTLPHDHLLHFDVTRLSHQEHRPIATHPLFLKKTADQPA